MVSSVILPDELLLKIFGFIDNQRTLLDILSMSRRFRRLGELVLYDSVIMAVRWDNIPYLLRRMSHLHNTATARKDLGASIRTLTLMVKRDMYELRSTSDFPLFPRHLVFHLLRELAGLRRLSIHFDPISLDLPNSYGVVPPFSLTHLRWNNPVTQEDMELFSAFLELQGSLEYLDIKWTDIQRLSLSDTALPCLHTLVADTNAAFGILPTRHILHLDIAVDGYDVDNDTLRSSLQHLQSLRCSTNFLHRVTSFKASFPDLEYVSLALDFTRWSNNSPSRRAIHPSTLLLSLGSQNLKYVYISPSISSFNAQPLFAAFPTLQAVDLPVPIRPNVYNRFTPQYSHHADQIRKQPVDLNGWDLWWSNYRIDDEDE